MPAVNAATVNATTPTLNKYLRRFVRGNDAQFQRSMSGFLPGDTPLNGWLTIKTSPAASDVSGVQIAITQVPSAEGVITLPPLPALPLATFNLQAIPSLNLNAGPLYYYDIKIQVTPSNNIYTVEQGFISFLPEVTDAPITQVFPNQNAVPPNGPVWLFGPNPPPNGPQAPGSRYLVTPLLEGMPAEWGFAASGFWRVLSVVSYGN